MCRHRDDILRICLELFHSMSRAVSSELFSDNQIFSVELEDDT